MKIWWTWSGSNRRPLPCHGSALPAAPQAHDRKPEESGSRGLLNHFRPHLRDSQRVSIVILTQRSLRYESPVREGSYVLGIMFRQGQEKVLKKLAKCPRIRRHYCKAAADARVADRTTKRLVALRPETIRWAYLSRSHDKQELAAADTSQTAGR